MELCDGYRMKIVWKSTKIVTYTFEYPHWLKFEL